MKTHKDLEVWKKSIDFVTSIYEITRIFPKDEIYGLISQMRRAAVSVPSNISEGAARKSHAEFRQYLFIAQGSLSEIETQSIISQNLKYISSEEFNLLTNQMNHIRSMLSGLIRSLK